MATRRARDRFLTQIVLGAAAQPMVAALWLEGETAARAQDPAGPFDLHAGLSDVDYDLFFRGHESFLRGCGKVLAHEDEPAVNGGHLCRVGFSGGLPMLFSMERLSQIPKRVRKAVVPLEDKTGGHLRHVLSYAPGHGMGT